MKDWNNKMLDVEDTLISQGYINFNDDFNIEKDNACLMADIITHYSIGGQQLMTDILVSMISKDINIECDLTYLADAINDYTIGDLTLNSIYVLLNQFAIMGEDCSEEDVEHWDCLYKKLKEKDSNVR